MTICNHGVEGNQNDRYPGMLFLRRRFIIRAKLNLPINYSSLCEKYAFFAFASRKREAFRAQLSFFLPENLDRSYSPPRKMLLRSRVPSRDFAHVCAETQWKTHVAGSHQRLLPRGLVFIRFAIQSARIPRDIRVSFPAPLSSVLIVPLRYLERLSAAQFGKMIKSSNQYIKFIISNFLN